MQSSVSPNNSPPAATQKGHGRQGSLVNRYATPLTTGLFAVSAISGIALFFHWAPSIFHEMHEWLSVVLLAPFALHAWRNWSSLLSYARRGTLILPLVAALVLSVCFAASGLMEGGRGGNPAFQTVALMTQARLTDLAPILKTTPALLLSTLQKAGYKVTSDRETLETIATASGKPAAEILFTLIPRTP